MKKIVALLMAAMMMGTLAACGGSTSSSAPAPESTAPSSEASASESAPAGDAAATPTLDKIKAKGELVMLTNAAFPPFEYVESTDPVGVDVDIATAIADAIGVKLKVVDMDFDGTINALMSGKGDIIAAGMTITDERKQSVDFSDTYFTSAQYLILPKDSTLATMEDLKGKKIGVQTGTTGDLYIDDAINTDEGALKGSGAELKQYKTGLEAALDLKNGRLDVVVLDQFPSQAIVDQNADSLKVSASPINDSESYAIAINKGQEDFVKLVNDTLATLKSEGKIDEFLAKHIAK